MDEPRVEEQALLAAEAPAARSQHPLVKAAVRIGVGGAVIGVLLATGDVSGIGRALREARPGHIAAAVGVMIGGLAVSAYRWQAYLRPLGFDLDGRTVLRLYFVGTFFNAFLPTGVGGDAYKAVRLRTGEGTLTRAFASVFLDRFAGVLALAIFGLTGVLVRLAAGDDGRVVVAALGGSLAIIGGSFGLLLLGGPLSRRLGASRSRWNIRERLAKVLEAIVFAGRHPGAAARGMAAGLVFQALVVAYHVLLLRALRIDVPVAVVTGMVVLASLATLVPLTLNGLGFREATYRWALVAYGVHRDVALAFAFLVLGVLLAASAVGGIVYVVAGGEVRSKRGG